MTLPSKKSAAQPHGQYCGQNHLPRNGHKGDKQADKKSRRCGVAVQVPEVRLIDPATQYLQGFYLAQLGRAGDELFKRLLRHICNG